VRQRVGVVLLAASIVDSLLWFSGWLHPMALRWRAAGGVARAITVVLGSLTFKAALLIVAALLAFWPRRT
jgi:branched-subunit amino acid transport protein